MSMKVATRQVDGVVVLDLSGRITLGEGSVTLRDAIHDALAKGSKKILLNLGNISYIDSSGNIPDPLAPENILRGSGRGIFLIRAFMDEVHFRQLHPGTELTLIKHRTPAQPAA